MAHRHQSSGQAETQCGRLQRGGAAGLGPLRSGRRLHGRMGAKLILQMARSRTSAHPLRHCCHSGRSLPLLQVRRLAEQKHAEGSIPVFWPRPCIIIIVYYIIIYILSSGVCPQARGSWAYMAPGMAPAAASLPYPTGVLEHPDISQTHLFTAQDHW